MNYDHHSTSEYFPSGAFEINARAREKEKHLDQLQAAWVVEHRPAGAQPFKGISTFIARLQPSLSMSGQQLIPTGRK